MKFPAFILIFLLIIVATAFAAETHEVAPGVLQLGEFQNAAITESSGLIPSRKGRGAFWTHNDGGRDMLYAMTATGQSLGESKLKAAEIGDWEDLAWNGGRLYLADIGNNDGNRNQVRVYAVPEPLPRGTREVRVIRAWTLEYPDEPFDAESLAVFRGHGYIVEKRNSGGTARLYRFPLKPSRQAVTLERLARLDLEAPAAGADATPDGRRLAVITRQGAYLFRFTGQIPQAGTIDPALFVPFEFDRMEGCCFTRDGLLVTAESGEIFLFTDPQFQLRAGARALGTMLR